jgi:hypothetical protein
MCIVHRKLGFAIVALVALAGSPVQAQTPPYAGKWASQPSQCRVGQEKENAPMIMRRDGYDQHETHCKFTLVRPQMPAWLMKGKCTVDGGHVDIDLTLELAGNRLTVRDENGASSYQRCP